MNMVLQQTTGLHEKARLDRKTSVTDHPLAVRDHPFADGDHQQEPQSDENTVTVNGHQYIKVNARTRRRGILIHNFQYECPPLMQHSSAQDCPYKLRHRQQHDDNDNVDDKDNQGEEEQGLHSWSEIRQAVTRKLSNMSLRKLSIGSSLADSAEPASDDDGFFSESDMIFL